MSRTMREYMWTFACVVCFGLGYYASYAGKRIFDTQAAYTEGRNSVLNSTVTVGGHDTPDNRCAVEIPLSALADMVNAGVIRWHEICEATE